MNTRLLMTLRVTVATPQSIGAVPHGTRRTDDGGPISMRSFGLRHGQPDVIEALARGEAVDTAAYYFRTTPRFEPAHPAYAFLNHLIAVASGDRRAEGPIYTIHELL